MQEARAAFIARKEVTNEDSQTNYLGTDYLTMPGYGQQALHACTKITR